MYFYKKKTANEISECDLSSDVCSSDLVRESGVVFQNVRSRNLAGWFLDSYYRVKLKSCYCGGKQLQSPQNMR